MSRLSAAPARLAVSGLLTLGLVGGGAAVSAESAHAAGAAATSSASVHTGFSARQGVSAVRIASSKAGTPYVWGAAGPRAFDCSGLTSWTFRRLGKSLPRTANGQYQSARKISRSSARPGDLVFYGGGVKTHVGIYAGGGRMWHAPHRGDVVKLSRVYGGAAFARVR